WNEAGGAFARGNLNDGRTAVGGNCRRQSRHRQRRGEESAGPASHVLGLLKRFHLGVVGVLTPKRTMLTPPRPVSGLSSVPVELASVMLRSASDMVPSFCARARDSTCPGVSSRVAVLPITTFWPFFSSTVWSIARTRIFFMIVSLVCTSVP